jgi:CO/xanthine dehydrogenase Mo-binding subunit
MLSELGRRADRRRRHRHRHRHVLTQIAADALEVGVAQVELHIGDTALP